MSSKIDAAIDVIMHETTELHRQIPKPKLSEIIETHLFLYGAVERKAVLEGIQLLEERLEAAEAVCSAVTRYQSSSSYNLNDIWENEVGPASTEWRKLKKRGNDQQT